MTGRDYKRTPVWVVFALLFAAGCSSSETPTFDEKFEEETEQSDPGIQCSIPIEEIFSGGVGQDGIPALTDPLIVAADEPGSQYLLPTDRVIGIRVGTEVIAVPHNILWWHEIVNFNFAGLQLAVTYCPLTGSSMVFDRASVQGAELGVSGLLYRNNLIMYNRADSTTLFPQMTRAGVCGAEIGLGLELYPGVEMTWEGWKNLHPNTGVISGATGYSRNYTRYPYGDYELPNNGETLFPMPPLDDRLPPKERVLGILKSFDGGIAYPFSELGKEPLQAIHTRLTAGPVVVLWDEAVGGAAAYFSSAGGQELTFEVRGDAFVDVGTGSVWGQDGVAVSGPLQGTALDGVGDAFVAFWFAWASFHPETVIWRSR